MGRPLGTQAGPTGGVRARGGLETGVMLLLYHHLAHLLATPHPITTPGQGSTSPGGWFRGTHMRVQ